jgi:hypothetical protein
MIDSATLEILTDAEAALRRRSIVPHVRLTYGGGTRPSGFHCALCDTRWGELGDVGLPIGRQEEHHAPECPLPRLSDAVALAVLDDPPAAGNPVRAALDRYKRADERAAELEAMAGRALTALYDMRGHDGGHEAWQALGRLAKAAEVAAR